MMARHRTGPPASAPAAPPTLPVAASAPATSHAGPPAPSVASVTVRVPSGYTLPSNLHTADEKTIAMALDVASKVVALTMDHGRAVSKREGDEAQQKLIDATMERAISYMARDMSTKHDTDRARMETQLQHARDETRKEVLAHQETQRAMAALEERVRVADDAAKARAIVELQKKHDRDASALETELRKRADGACLERDELRQSVEKSQKLVAELRAENERLKTPSGKGESGESTVREILSEQGFQVIDTSAIAEKHRYGDILAIAPRFDTSYDSGGESAANSAANSASAAGAAVTTMAELSANSANDTHRGIRLAIEVKNAQNVRSSAVRNFERKVREGVAAGLFEGGIFLSLRCALPQMPQTACQKILEDDDGLACIPMAYLGCERKLNPEPVSNDHIEVLVQMHADLAYAVQQTRRMARSATNNTAEADYFTRAVQNHFHDLALHAQQMFVQFATAAETIQHLKTNLDQQKKQTISFLRTARRLNTLVPWLRRDMPLLTCERGLNHAIRLLSEGRLVWSNVSSSASVLSTLGRECAHGIAVDELAAIAKETTELEELHAKIRMTSEIVPSPRAEPTEPPPAAAVHLVDVERAGRADTTTTSSAKRNTDTNDDANDATAPKEKKRRKER